MSSDWMIYGANGYTGRLIVAEACRQGLHPVLAGRNGKDIEAMAADTGLAYRVFSLDDSAALREALEAMSLVLHCAGPFSATSQPMIEACLEKHCHYLDITGEISVFANAHEQSETARRANVVLLPGVGFDVVPTDCLAAMLVRALPEAILLQLAFASSGRASPGTAKTSVEGLGNGGCVRRDGRLKRVPLAWKTRTIPFSQGERLAVTIPWGDVYTAYVSTGVPAIEVYMSASPAMIKRLQRLRLFQPLLAMRWVREILKNRIGKSLKGPGPEERERAKMHLWGEVSSADGRTATATMTTPNGYDVTATASLGIVTHLLDREIEGGFYTPSLLMGADYITRLPGVTMEFL